MDNNMISNCFIGEPVAIAPPQPASFSNRGAPGRGRISISNESFLSASMNHENFGDWGSFNNASESFSNHDNDAKVNDPFSEQKDENEDGFINVIDRKVVPKLPVSKREIRKVTSCEDSQPTIIFEADEEILMSPLPFGSPVLTRNFHSAPIRPEPSRSVQRSVSDYNGSFSQRDIAEPLKTDSPSTSFRSLFRSQQESERSLSFSQRRKPVTNRALLMEIGKRRNSYRNLSLEDEDEEDVRPQKKTPNRALLRQIGERKKSYRNLSLEDDDDEPQKKTPNRALLMQIGEKRKSYRSLSIDEDDDEPRRTPPNRALLLQIGEKRKSYRSLIMEEDDDDDRPPTQPQRLQTPNSVLQNFQSDDDEPFEGTLPLKAEPEPVAVKKRSTSRDRLNKMRSDDPDTDDHTHPRPTRKSSTRRLTSRKASLSDSNRSNGTSISKASRSSKASSKRISRPMDEEIEFYVEPSSPMKSAKSSDPERNTMLAEVQRERNAKRSSEKGGRKRSQSRKKHEGSKEKSKPAKKKSSNEEINKHTNRCKNRRTVGRRASMTGNIVDMEDEAPREKRRSSMDHFKSDTAQSRPKERRRRNTMDHFRPSPTQSVSPSDDRKKSRSKNNIRALSERDMTLSSHVSGKEPSIFVPFGEEGTETTKGTEESHEMSNSMDRGRPLSRKSSMQKVKSKERRSNSAKRIVGRSRSGLGKERQRSKSRQRESDLLEDKTVTVEEILAVVASAHKPSSRARRSRSNTVDTIDGSSKSGGIDISSRSGMFDISSRSGNASLTASSKSDCSGSPTAKNRKKHRSRSRQKDGNSSFSRIRKGKRVEHHPDEEPAPEESTNKKKDKPVVIGKESRHRWGSRRGSAR